MRSVGDERLRHKTKSEVAKEAEQELRRQWRFQDEQAHDLTRACFQPVFQSGELKAGTLAAMMLELMDDYDIHAVFSWHRHDSLKALRDELRADSRDARPA